MYTPRKCRSFRDWAGMLLAKVERELQVAVNQAKRGFVIREAWEEDLPEMVGFLAKLALHVSGAPPHDLKESEYKRLLRTLHSALDDHVTVDNNATITEIPRINRSFLIETYPGQE